INAIVGQRNQRVEQGLRRRSDRNNIILEWHIRRRVYGHRASGSYHWVVVLRIRVALAKVALAHHQCWHIRVENGALAVLTPLLGDEEEGFVLVGIVVPG